MFKDGIFYVEAASYFFLISTISETQPEFLMDLGDWVLSLIFSTLD